MCIWILGRPQRWAWAKCRQIRWRCASNHWACPSLRKTYDYFRSSHHCRLGHERLPDSIKIPIWKRVLPDDKVYNGGETDSPGNRCCCGSWKHGSPRHIEYFNLFLAEKLGWIRLQKECDTICQGAETGKRVGNKNQPGIWDIASPLLWKIFQGVHLVYKQKELGRSTFCGPARLPPCNRHCGLLPHLSLVLYFFCNLSSSGFTLRAQIR